MMCWMVEFECEFEVVFMPQNFGLPSRQNVGVKVKKGSGDVISHDHRFQPFGDSNF